jgi:hypothetical protein
MWFELSNVVVTQVILIKQGTRSEIGERLRSCSVFTDTLRILPHLDAVIRRHDTVEITTLLAVAKAGRLSMSRNGAANDGF